MVRASTQRSLDDVAGKADKSLRYGERGWRWAQTAMTALAFVLQLAVEQNCQKGCAGKVMR